MDGLRLESKHGATTGGRDLQVPEDLLVRGFRLDEVPDLVAVPGMGIGPGHSHPDIGFESLTESPPGAGVSGIPEETLDAGEQEVGQDGDEEMRPRPVGRLVKDRTHPQIALEC